MGRLEKVFITLTILFVCSCASKRALEPVSMQANLQPSQKLNKSCFTGVEAAVMIDHQYFEVCYDPNFRLARYVKHTVKKENVESAGTERRNKFTVDKKLIEKNLPYVKPQEYVGSGYDRGHLAPAADFAYSQRAMDLSFVMSNMAPQSKSLNQRAWLKLETQVRKWACGEGHLTVITGPILKSGLKKLRSGLAIPEKFFKVVIDETAPKKALAFVYSQKDNSETFYSERLISFADLHKETQHNFSDLLPYSEQGIFKQPADLPAWKSCR